MVLPPKVATDITLSLSGTHSLGTCDAEPSLDAAEQMPVSLYPDLGDVTDDVFLAIPQADQLLHLELGKDPSVEAGLSLKEVAELHVSNWTNVVVVLSCYLTKRFVSRSKTARRTAGADL